MKKTFLTVLLFCLLFLPSCVFTYNLNEKNPAVQMNEKEDACELVGVQYVRTNGYVENFEYPRLIRITSRDELESYYNYFSGIYFLDAVEEIYSDTTIGWITACEKYDKEFFDNCDLYMAVLEEGSGSIRHSVEGVENGSVTIRSITPEVCTDDMAEWHIMLEVTKGGKLSKINRVSVNVTSPDEIYEEFYKVLENTALEYLKTEHITDAELKFCEKTTFGEVKNLDFSNPLGYSPGHDASPVWKMDFVKKDGTSFTLLLCVTPFVFGSIGL